ncbi:hypothetical protein BDM02DRAFT_3188873 [Thelephora ganbajun]|uniref:Uncharacterized protein n=1 Tax=Thelephora ganbajun TaxID=370292 RepID=A0ACB6ZA57_THEGA|nr:hypothetical protein BDM02DRAFT_3188873 [Thelephora ganbajun]
MRDISVSQGYLYATIMEGILYGFNIALSIVYAFVFDNKGQFTNNVVKYSVYSMFILSTAHLGGAIRSLEEGFFTHSGPSDFYFNNKALPLNLVNKSLYGATMVVGDALMIYRVWLIYGKSWKVVIFPMFTLLGTLVCTIFIVWELSQLKPGQTVFQKTVSTTVPAAFALPFATNIVITFLIVFRIKQAQDAIARLSASGVGVGTADKMYKRVVWGVIESCAIYPVFLLLSVVLYFLKTNALALITGPMTQVVAIVPTLMWLQVILGRSQYDQAAQAAGFTTETIGHGVPNWNAAGWEWGVRRDYDV